MPAGLLKAENGEKRHHQTLPHLLPIKRVVKMKKKIIKKKKGSICAKVVQSPFARPCTISRKIKLTSSASGFC